MKILLPLFNHRFNLLGIQCLYYVSKHFWVLAGPGIEEYHKEDSERSFINSSFKRFSALVLKTHWWVSDKTTLVPKESQTPFLFEYPPPLPGPWP